MSNIKNILAIDTSCDETSVAILNETVVLSNLAPSQMEYHKKFGGVVPSLAKLAHQDKIENTIQEALKRAKKEITQIDAIAVTKGPGLAIALEVGIRKAKELSKKYNKPLITINHMEGHLLSSFALRNSKDANLKINEIEFPALGFLVSGGHTELILVEEFGNYKKIGETLDDSCGEAYDKCGRMLGLGYPAGPVITEFSKIHRKQMKIRRERKNQGEVIIAKNKNTKDEYSLPIAMVNSGDLNFSYSGLKTSFKQLIDRIVVAKGELNNIQIMDLAVAFEAAALTQLSIKLERAIIKYSPKELWLGGGVIASAKLKSAFRKITNKYGIKLRAPFSNKLTGDNAAMIGVAAYLNTANPIYLPDTVDPIDRDPTLSL